MVNLPGPRAVSRCFDPFSGGEIDAYNREGSLIVWHNGQEEIMTGHQRRVAGSKQAKKTPFCKAR